MSKGSRTTRVSAQSGGHLPVALATARFAPVFPCLPTKAPATPRGFHNATADPGRITAWWGRHPDHLVAVPTQGLLVVDLDTPDDGRPPATSWDAWLALAAPHGWQPGDCPLVATPSGGLHIYWTQPPDMPARNTAGRLGDLIDTRGDGGYVIAPGSTLPDGRSYELLQPYPPGVPVAPGWLVELCEPAPVPPPPAPPPGGHRPAETYGERALESELARLAAARPGGRNDQLNRSAHALGQLVTAGRLDAHAAHDGLLTVALRIGLPQAEAETTIQSGMRAGFDAPRGVTA